MKKTLIINYVEDTFDNPLITKKVRIFSELYIYLEDK